jgi:cytochrome c oxidase subunit 4
MQALRLARNIAAVKPPSLLAAHRRRLATATVNQVHLNSVASSSIGASGGRIAPIPLSNIEARWELMTGEDKLSVHEQLEALQVKDWKELSLDEKKAGKSCYKGRSYNRALSSFFCVRCNDLYLNQNLTPSFAVAYYVAFGPHGPRTPTSQPGDSVKILFSTLALIAAGGILFFSFKAFSAFPDSLRSFLTFTLSSYSASSS